MTPKTIDDVTAFPLSWPPDKPRIAQRAKPKFKTSMAKALAEIDAEMGPHRWDAEQHVISMAPAYRRGPVDPAVAVWWTMRRTAAVLHAIACDNYPTPEANLHAIALTLEGLRAFERYGTYSREQAISGARLLAIEDLRGRVDWRGVLDVGADWPLQAVELAYQSKARQAHPDVAGDGGEAMAALNEAIDAARKELAHGRSSAA